MRPRPLHLATLAVGAALILLSCRGEDKLGDAMETVSDNDLAIMVLAREDLGEGYTDFDLVRSASGPLDNAGAADLRLDLQTSEADLDELGRTDGYSLEYATGTSATSEDGSLETYVGVRTVIHVIDDADGADRYIQSELEGAAESEGREEGGFRLEHVEAFDVEDIADQSAGLRISARIEGVGELDATAVLFRIGRLVGEVLVTRGDSEESAGEVKRIAGLLAERVEQVLLGEIDATPVPIATPTEEDGLDAARAAEADDDPGLPGEYVDLPAIYGGAYGATARHVTRDFDYARDCAVIDSGEEICNGDPPAGGPHWSVACDISPADSPAFCGPARWGIYQDSWQPETLVHNMEHGGVVLWYNTTDQDVIDEMESLFVERLNEGQLLVMAPYANLEPETIALTSWSRREVIPLTGYTRDRVEAFIDAHERRFNPERF